MGAGVTAHVDFGSVKRASLDWCPQIAALSASSGAVGQMPTALSAEQLRDLKATLEELEDMYSKLEKGKVCSPFPFLASWTLPPLIFLAWSRRVLCVACALSSE